MLGSFAILNIIMKRGQNKQGFTIVELLIVIVVIGILAAITMVAFSTTQGRARDAQRKSDVEAIVKALELHYNDKGYYPNATTYTPGSTTINAAWSTTADASWANLEAVLQPYINKLPRDPASTPAVDIRSVVGYDYQYFGNQSTYCGVAPGQAYVLNYRLESSPQVDNLDGTCNPTVIGPYGSSDYRVVK